MPSWMIVELLPIGTWSILYTNLKYRSDKKNISDTFKLSPIECGSCLHTLTYIRNLCAHRY
ncbi:Abi family protein [Legionella sainthelensi]|uniref:Abi family protein n=1 Tax=Legionella sainthelensi TaxID=28087 RepID=UPI003B8A94F0